VSLTGALTRPPLAPALWGLDGLSPAARAARYGVVGAWNLEDTADSFGANTLTNNGVATFAAGKLSNAVNLVATSSQYLSIVDNPALSTGNVDFWFALWVNLTTKGSGFPFIAGKAGSSSVLAEFNFDFNVATDQFRFVTGGASNVISSAAAGTNTATWYFLMGYHDAANDLTGISRNGGAFVTTATAGVAPSDTATDFTIGARGNVHDRFLDGMVDAAVLGKSPSGGVAAIRDEIRDFMWNGGVGRQYPTGWAA
jgi:hypothetical protein